MEAVFGLVGVLLGGLLAGGLDLAAKRREERAVVRSLARSIFVWLTDYRSQLDYAESQQDGWQLLGGDVTLARSWDGHELTLYRHLTWDEWTALQAVRASERAVRAVASEAVKTPLVDSHLRAVCDASRAAIDHAMPAIQRRCQDPRAVRRLGRPTAAR